MKPTLRFALLLVAAASLAPPVAQGAEPALEGMYGAAGFNPDGSEYRGVVKIVRRGQSFVVAWIFPRQVGEEILLVPISAGAGVTSGGMLAVSYYGQDATGVILYQIENGGQRLIGRWVPANGEGAVYSETLTKLPEPAAVPDSGTRLPPAPKKPSPAVRRNVVAVR